jgi:excinuclease ABC subunit B
VQEIRFTTAVADAREQEAGEASERQAVAEPAADYRTPDLTALMSRIEEEMMQAAEQLDFERAARLRDELFEVKARIDTGSSGRVRRDRRGQVPAGRSEDR